MDAGLPVDEDHSGVNYVITFGSPPTSSGTPPVNVIIAPNYFKHLIDKCHDDGSVFLLKALRTWKGPERNAESLIACSKELQLVDSDWKVKPVAAAKPKKPPGKSWKPTR